MVVSPAGQETGTVMNQAQFRSTYKALSIALSVLFAVVGLIFFLMPADVLVLFNNIARMCRMEESPVQGYSFYLILAVGYMYLVSLLAFMMFLHPENKSFIVLLINAKAASSIISIIMFVFQRPYLIYGVNAVIDGSIALLMTVLYTRLKVEKA